MHTWKLPYNSMYVNIDRWNFRVKCAYGLTRIQTTNSSENCAKLHLIPRGKSNVTITKLIQSLLNLCISAQNVKADLLVKENIISMWTLFTNMKKSNDNIEEVDFRRTVCWRNILRTSMRKFSMIVCCANGNLAGYRKLNYIWKHTIHPFMSWVRKIGISCSKS